MKIALFGGRFDPPHKGHMAIATSVLRFDPSIDELWFMPVPQHSWKSCIASPMQRLEMVKLLEGGKIKASNYDIYHNFTYAIDTITHLKRYSPHTYVWVCGADTIKDFSRWKDYKKLQETMKFLVVPRNPYAIKDIPENFILVTDPTYVPSNLSSTLVRERIKEHRPIDFFVPKKVVQYIRIKGLYQ